MSTVSTNVRTSATSRPYLALGLTFILLGVGFAFPLRLAPQSPRNIWEGSISPEALNLYALTSFAGWSHFAYAWRGQWLASRRFSTGSRAGYWFAIFGLLIMLLALRAWSGVAIFSLLAWVYNISHFVKAEIFFSGTKETRTAFYSPVVAFAWFTLCLFQVGPLKNISLIFVGSVFIAGAVLVVGGWRLLANGDVLLPLLTLFLLGETLVWAAYSPYMSEAFRVGVYIIHIAAASFYHYLSAYFYAESSIGRGKDHALKPLSILTINVATIGIGLVVAWLPQLKWLRPLAGLEWFTLWVALHLAASDLLPFWKRHPSTAL
ncbi:MAG: hypothetical protein JST61_05150 [Acidobacteria bacterium]|nr:hypothetical protein [Acidobacteriota bacterium]